MTSKPSSINTGNTGLFSALLAAALFGASTPLNKLLLGGVSPILLAGLLYLGSGFGLTVLYLLRRVGGRSAEAPLQRKDVPWLLSAIICGGVLGALMLMFGLQLTPGSTASLLLNMEGVFTAGLAWIVFREHADRRVLLGMLLIVVGSLALSWQGGAEPAPILGIGLILGACLSWAIDNNLMQKISASDPFQIAAIKGLIAGCFNTVLGLVLGAQIPAVPVIGGAMLIGLAGYGLSMAFFVLALRSIGTARTGAYYAIAPFVGALLSVLILGEPLSPQALLAGLLMGIGVWLHLTERHGHGHQHTTFEHAHRHTHDEHHQHAHALGVAVSEPHTHPHAHAPDTHMHPHYPDIHHRHVHESAMEPIFIHTAVEWCGLHHFGT